MKELRLTNSSLPVLVDDADYEWLAQYPWRADSSGKNGRRIYATSTDVPGYSQVYMHRLIMLAGELSVDHVNMNGLDNRRENLRIATKAQQSMNVPKKRGTSRYKGVHWYPPKKKWRVQIRVEGKLLSLGYYFDEVEAAIVYDKAALLHFKEFARTNF